MKIDIPEKTDYNSSVEFIKTLFKSVLEPEPIHLNFGTIRFAEPFGTLLIAESIKEFVANRKNNSKQTTAQKVEPDESEACSYLSHVGFWIFRSNRPRIPEQIGH